MREQSNLLLPGEIVVDNFACGGGASEGIEAALGRPVDFAINHNAKALDCASKGLDHDPDLRSSRVQRHERAMKEDFVWRP